MSTPRAAAPLHLLAHCLSGVGHPYLVIPASVAALSALRGGDLRAASQLAWVFGALAVAVLVGIGTGRFNDFDVSERKRRPAFYVLLLTASVALGVWLRAAPEALQACAIAAAMLAACGLLNGWTKASLHSAFALYAAGLWGAWCIGAGLAALPVAAAVAWSRTRLGRHSCSEVLAGAAVGLVGALCLVLL